MTQDQKNATWLITVNEGGQNASTYQVSAAYTRTDQSNYPGYVLLHDEDKNLVALVPYAPTLLIRRADSDPTLTPRAGRPSAPQVTITTTQPGAAPAGVPSPAAMAALRERAAKAVRP